MIKQDCIIYTAKPSKRLDDAARIAEKVLNETAGRELRIRFRKVKAQKKVPTERDERGKIRIAWPWMRAKFADLTHELIGFHFTTADRKRYKLTATIDGSSDLHFGVGYFYLAADPGVIAPGYKDLPEVAQLLIHEISHIDAALTGAPSFVVHAFEDKLRIQDLPKHFSYENVGALQRSLINLKLRYAALTA